MICNIFLWLKWGGGEWLGKENKGWICHLLFHSLNKFAELMCASWSILCSHVSFLSVLYFKQLYWDIIDIPRTARSEYNFLYPHLVPKFSKWNFCQKTMQKSFSQVDSEIRLSGAINLINDAINNWWNFLLWICVKNGKSVHFKHTWNLAGFAICILSYCIWGFKKYSFLPVSKANSRQWCQHGYMKEFELFTPRKNCRHELTLELHET